MSSTIHHDLSLKYVLNVPSRKSNAEALPLVVILHGRGADANDLADIAPYLDESAASGGGFRFVFPNAPRPFERA